MTKNYLLTDIIDIEFLQQFQDAFANAFKVASITVDSQGPITKPSNFTDFCIKFTRSTKKGYEECNQCDIRWGKISAGKGEPVIYKCHSGLTDFAVPIIIEGEHIASILGGQVLTQKADEKKFREYARFLNINEDEYIDALREISIVTEEHVQNAANMMYFLANSISKIGYKKLKLIEKIKSEELHRKVIETVRHSLDIEETLSVICRETTKFFDIQRATIAVFPNSKNYKEFLFRKQYITSPKYKQFKLTDEGSYVAEYWANKLLKTNTVLAIDNISESNTSDGFKKVYKEMGVKSIMGTSIRKGKNVWGTLVISEYKKFRHWSEEEKTLLKTIADQIYIAIVQSELFDQIKETATKESILKEIISEIKLTRDLEEAYKTLLKKLVEIFGINRALFLESAENDSDELNIKYEYSKQINSFPVDGSMFPQVCKDAFLDLIHNLKPLVINNINDCQSTKIYKFYDICKIKALLAVPLVKQNARQTIFGFVVLCSENEKEWTNKEIQLLEDICSSVVSIIWEISNFNKVEELRNSFVLTLTHDIQVPLVGEKIALEYLHNNTSGKNLELVNELIENNKNVSNFLNKSMDLYNYEMGKKQLEIIEINLIEFIKKIIFSLKDYIELKSTSIHIKSPKRQIITCIDKTEMRKVFYTIIKNAIDHSPSGENVEINITKNKNLIQIGINNKGKAIPENIQKRIFKRHKMVLSIERKIGSGVELVLSKEIVEAHNGFVKLESNNKDGTTFYIFLPKKQ